MKSIGVCTLASSGIVDYFMTKDGQTFAGLHLLIEIWNGANLTESEKIETILREAASASKASVLHSHIHHFSPFSGVSGVLLLAESHISIHTWPERKYAAIDIFMCGSCDPYLAIPVLKKGFQAPDLKVTEIRRGIVIEAD